MRALARPLDVDLAAEDLFGGAGHEDVAVLVPPDRELPAGQGDDEIPAGAAGEDARHRRGARPGPARRRLPAPRSQTRIEILAGDSACTNSTLTRRGKSASASILGPSCRTGHAARFSVKMTQCGFPIETQVMRLCSLASVTSRSTILPCSRTGIFGPSSSGTPMSTVIRPPPPGDA